MNPSDIRISEVFSVSYMRIENGADVEFKLYGSALTLPPRRAKGALHRHSHYELVYVLDGELIQHFETGTFRYQRGDACFLNRNIRHCEGFESDCQLFFVNLPPHFVDALFMPSDIQPERPQYQEGPIARFLSENRNESFGSEYIDCAGSLGQKEEDAPFISALLQDIACELSSARTGYAFRVKALLLSLFSELENPEHYHLSRIRVDSRPEEFIYARMMRYLEERHGHVTREELGRILNYNGDYLNRIAKRQSGRTLSQLGHEILLRDARYMLAETDLSIARIIEELGCSNRSHFYALFEANTGMKPGEWRALHLNDCK